jgi:tetratricopeptide (TPR) repeat protein
MPEGGKKSKTKTQYFREANGYLRKGDGRSAMRVLKEGLESYPSEPFLLSYYGCLVSSVGRDPGEGIRLCREALRKLRNSAALGDDYYYPLFYLNLGRAYLTGGDKPEAIKAFKRGLRVDPGNKYIIAELRKLGVRKPPALPFLRREHPINKYVGLIMRKGPVRKTA